MFPEDGIFFNTDAKTSDLTLSDTILAAVELGYNVTNGTEYFVSL
jgi:hypothetical protein